MLKSPRAAGVIRVVDATRDPCAAANPSDAKQLVDAILASTPWYLWPFFWLGLRSTILDALAHEWLRRNPTSYLSEIESVADHLNLDGAYALNLAYEVDFLCTAHVGEDSTKVPIIRRTLDWGFPAMGRHVLVAKRKERAGEYFDVTWPGLAGTLTAMAPGRFALALNQAPLFMGWTNWEFGAELRNTLRVLFMKNRTPPLQLLRRICDEAGSFDEALDMLKSANVTKGCLISIIGPASGQMARVEIGKDDTPPIVTHGAGAFANNWLEPDERWRGRACAIEADPRADSATRREIIELRAGVSNAPFDWVAWPVLNRYTCIAVEMSVGQGFLRVIGLEAVGNEREGDKPDVRQVTQLLEIPTRA